MVKVMLFFKYDTLYYLFLLDLNSMTTACLNLYVAHHAEVLVCIVLSELGLHSLMMGPPPQLVMPGAPYFASSPSCQNTVPEPAVFQKSLFYPEDGQGVQVFVGKLCFF